MTQLYFNFGRQVHTIFVLAMLLICIAGRTQAVVGSETGTETGLEVPQLPRIEGIVVAVADDGFFTISPSGNNDDLIRVRQWAFQVEPEVLALVLLGRKVRCRILYTTDEFMGGICFIEFFDEDEDTPWFRGLDSIYDRTVPLTSALTKLNLGYFACDEIDLEYLPPISRFFPYRSYCE